MVSLRRGKKKEIIRVQYNEFKIHLLEFAGGSFALQFESLWIPSFAFCYAILQLLEMAVQYTTMKPVLMATCIQRLASYPGLPLCFYNGKVKGEEGLGTRLFRDHIICDIPKVSA